ncbi:hypothetical protein GGS21DRAFT_144748 [Xylaria nigripes]|nr:hypothetical protein GGS21DRAFT_144748 [Xylaria nigripes]
MARNSSERVRTPSPSNVPLPESPTYSCASTANPISTFNLPMPPPPKPIHAVLTKADLEQSHLAYSELLATAKSYRLALATLSTAASAFGSALEACARLKESRADSFVSSPTGGPSMPVLSNSYSMKSTSCTADHLMSTSGVHYLIANHQQILSETVYRSFEVPLLHDLDKWRRDIEDAENSYQKEVAQRSREIRRLEKEGLKLHKQRRRDLSKFREHLVELTGKLDGLSSLHGDHAQGLLRESQEASTKILDASCSLVRAEVDIFEGLARKGWSGGGLDELLERGRDLFAADDDVVPGTGSPGSAVGSATNEGTKLFSILPPKSILADAVTESGTKGQSHGHTRSDSLLTDTERYQSLAGAFSGQEDMDSIFSDFNHSRGVRPFSPQPIRKLAEDVIMDPESLIEVEGDGEFQLQVRRPKATDEARRESDGISHNTGSEGTNNDDEHNDNEKNALTASPRDTRSDDEARAGLSPAGGAADHIESPWKDEGLHASSASLTENI